MRRIVLFGIVSLSAQNGKMAKHLGAQFVRNYLTHQWSKDRNQPTWTLQPSESEIFRVRVLQQVGDVEPFRGLQLVFEIVFHEEHPQKAPSIKVLTPNGRMEINESICINGLTAWHPESWSIIASVESIIERFMIAFLDLENVKQGVGFVKLPSKEEMASQAVMSPDQNKENFLALVSAWEEQRNDYTVSQMMKELNLGKERKVMTPSTLSAVSTSDHDNDDEQFQDADDDDSMTS